MTRLKLRGRACDGTELRPCTSHETHYCDVYMYEPPGGLLAGLLHNENVVQQRVMLRILCTTTSGESMDHIVWTMPAV